MGAEKKMKNHETVDGEPIKTESLGAAVVWFEELEEYLKLALKESVENLQIQLSGDFERQKLLELKQRLSQSDTAVPEDDVVFVAYLREKKYNIEPILAKLKLWHELRNQTKHVYSTLNQELFNELIKSKEFIQSESCFQIIPHSQDFGQTIYIISFEHLKPSNMIRIWEIVSGIIGEIGTYSPENSIVGIQLIIDLKHFSASHLAQTVIHPMKAKFNAKLNSVFPFKLSKINIINNTTLMQSMLKFFSTVLSDKTRQKILIHNTIDELHQHIPIKILPEFLGGPGPTRDQLVVSTKIHYESNSHRLQDAGDFF